MFYIPITLITSGSTDKSNLEKDKFGLQPIKLRKTLFLMVSFLKMPFKFRQVIYLASQPPLFVFFYEEGACIDYQTLHYFLSGIFKCLTTAFLFGPAFLFAHGDFVLSICSVLCTRHFRQLPCRGQDCSTLGIAGLVQSCPSSHILGGNSRGSCMGKSGGAGSDPNSATSFKNVPGIHFF